VGWLALYVFVVDWARRNSKNTNRGCEDYFVVPDSAGDCFDNWKFVGVSGQHENSSVR
jgi:hypothetical protein